MSANRRKLSDITGQNGKDLSPVEKKHQLAAIDTTESVEAKNVSSTESSDNSVIQPTDNKEGLTVEEEKTKSSVIRNSEGKFNQISLFLISGLTRLFRPATNKAKQSSTATAGHITAQDIEDDLLKAYPWLRKLMYSRLVKFLAYANDDKQYYSLLRLLSCLVWEKKVDGSIMACNTLHTSLSSKPVMIWIVGQVTKRWFFDKNGEAYNQAAIHIRPLTTSSFAAARLLMKRLGAPNGTLDDASGELRASCFCSRQVRSVRASETAAFDDIYDACIKFRSKSGQNAMATLDAADIQDNDIVLVKAMVIRYDKNYSKKDGRNDGKSASKKTSIPDWAFLFQLHSISLLFMPTDKPDVEDERGFCGSL